MYIVYNYKYIYTHTQNIVDVFINMVLYQKFAFLEFALFLK